MFEMRQGSKSKEKISENRCVFWKSVDARSHNSAPPHAQVTMFLAKSKTWLETLQNADADAEARTASVARALHRNRDHRKK
jgi:hypothetical protein